MTEEENLSQLLNSKYIFFSLNNPGFQTCAACMYNEKEHLLFMPVLNKYLKGTNPDKFTIRVGYKDSRYALITGELLSATNGEDIDYVYNRLVKETDKPSPTIANYILYDQRNNKPRKYRYKLKIKKVLLCDVDFYGDSNVREFEF